MNIATTLQEEVEKELRWDPEVHAERIGVTVRDSVVQLDGHVESLFEKWAAENAALRVADVRGVANEIIVEIPMPDRKSDAAIAEAIVTQLDWNHLIPDTVKVKVSNGWVTFEGFVEAQYQRREVERVLRSLKGVKGFVNQIEIKPLVNVTLMKEAIIEAIRRNAALDAENIEVISNGGVVTLRGRVSSWMERAEARRTAWSAPGVTLLIDELTFNFD